MQTPEKQHPRVTFALPPPSPSPPQELQQQKQPTTQSPSQQKRAERKTEERKRPAGPPSTLTAAQLMAHAAGPPTAGGSITHAPQSPRGSSPTASSSASSSSWTVSYPRLGRVPDTKPLPAVDSDTSWPGVIGYQRLPSCYESPGEIGPSSAGAVRLLGTTHGPASVASSSATPPVSNSTLRILDGADATGSTTLTPRSRSSGVNSRRGTTRKQPWTWSWTPGAETSPIYDPDYADGPPECLTPRPTLPSSTSTVTSLDADPKRTGRSDATKRLRGGEATPPNQVKQDDTRSNASGSSSAGSYASSADSSQLFVTEVGGVGTIGTVESIWGEQLSEFRTLPVRV